MTQLTRDDALMWLNDRLGKSVHVSVNIDKGDYPVSLFAAAGELRHWRADKDLSDPWLRGDRREEITGLYEVGDATLDLTDIAGRTGWVRDDDGFHSLAVELAEDVTLEIIEQRAGTFPG